MNDANKKHQDLNYNYNIKFKFKSGMSEARASPSLIKLENMIN